jgi:transposase
MDTERLCAKVRETFDQGPDAVVDLVVTLVGEVAAQVEGLAATVAALQAENATLRTENAALRARLRTDSHNSSKPPSSDGPGVKPHPKSQRLPTGRKTGGQPGHVGHTLGLVDEPDEVVVHGPSCCPGCGRDLGDVPAVRRERRQIVDLPPVRARIVEHQVETKCCPTCGTEATGAFPAEVAAPVQYGPGVATVAVYLNQAQLLPLERTSEVLADLFGCPIAEGTVERAVAECHDQLAGVEAAIKQGVTEAEVTHFDETGLDLSGKTAWLHVASTRQLTFYAAQAKRGREAMELIGVLPQFRGRAIHDGLVSYWQYEECTHGLCNGHHLRELTFVAEELGQPWAQEMGDLLREIKQAVDTARDHGLPGLAAEVKEEFVARYATLLAAGTKANPPPKRTGRRGRPKLGKAGSLVERLREHQEATLAFMDDFATPFDNNQAERDLRMVKVREKISGCFRTSTGAERFCRIRGYLSTLRKQGMPILSSLRQALTGNPPLPATT